MRGLQSPLFVCALLVALASSGLPGFSAALAAPCVRGAGQLGAGIESLGAGVIILLDVSTSMYGADADKLNIPFYNRNKDVMEKAVAELEAALQGFQYGDITLFAFQGRSSNNDFSQVADEWGLPAPDAKKGAWVAYRFTFPKREQPANLDRLWNTVKSVQGGMRGWVSDKGIRRGTGTYIGETLRDAVKELTRLLEQEEKKSGGVPFGYMIRVLLVTDSRELVDPQHEAERVAAWKEVDEELAGLQRKLGEQLVIEQLYWGDACPEGQVKKSLTKFNYECVPHEGLKQYTTIVPFPGLFRVADNPATTEWIRIPFLFLCSSAAVPKGRLQLSVEDVYLCRSAGTSPPLVLDDAIWVRLDTRGLFVGVGTERDDSPLPQVTLPAPTEGEYSQVAARIFLPRKELARLVDEIYPKAENSPIALVVRLGFTFEPSSGAEDAPVRFSDDRVTVYAFYEKPSIALEVTKNADAADRGVLRVAPNQAAFDAADARHLPFVVKYDPSQVAFSGLGPMGEIEPLRAGRDEAALPFRILRPLGVSGSRLTPVAVQLGEIAVASTTIRVHDAAIHPDPSRELLTMDVRPLVEAGNVLRCPLELRSDRADSVTVWTTLAESNELPGLKFSLDKGSVPSPSPVNDGSWVVSLEVSYPDGTASLRALNRDGPDLKLQFSATATDPSLFVTVPSDLMRVDLQYTERLVRVDITPSPQLVDLVPGDPVALIVMHCSPDLEEAERGIHVTVDPRLLAIDATEGLRDEGEGRYVLLAAGRDEVECAIRVARRIWDCPVVSGAQRTAIAIRCLVESARCDLPSDESRSLTFGVAERPALVPRVDPDPKANPDRWQRLRSSREIAIVAYDLTEAASARIELSAAVRLATSQAGAADFFVVSGSEKTPGTFTISTRGAPYGARGVIEFRAVDAACGLPVDAPSPVKFGIETIWPRLLWIGVLTFWGLTLAAVAAFVVYAKVGSNTLFDALDYLWGFERWTVFASAGVLVVAIAMMAAFLVVR